MHRRSNWGTSRTVVIPVRNLKERIIAPADTVTRPVATPSAFIPWKTASADVGTGAALTSRAGKIESFTGLGASAEEEATEDAFEALLCRRSTDGEMPLGFRCKAGLFALGTCIGVDRPAVERRRAITRGTASPIVRHTFTFR